MLRRSGYKKRFLIRIYQLTCRRRSTYDFFGAGRSKEDDERDYTNTSSGSTRSMVAASGSHGRWRKLDLLHPNLLPSLSVALSPADLKSFHAHIISTGRSGDAFAVGRLLATSCDLLLRHAAAVFSAFRRPTLPMYNSMIRGFSRSSDPAESAIIFLRMLRSGISPDWFTFPFLLRSCTADAQLGGFGMGIHGQALKLGLVSDVHVANNLISFYSGRRDMCSARRVFDENSGVADVVSWTAMVSGYSGSGQLADAR